MFRVRPALAADLLAGPLRVPVPPFEAARLSSSELTEVAPTEYRADAVVTLNVGGKPVLGVVIEVQLHKDPRKRYVWPVYIATLQARLECPVVLLVLCHHPDVAAWCARPMRVCAMSPMWTPLVLGPQRVPVVTDDVLARLQPELTVLSTLAHGDREDPTAVFEALLAALDSIDLDRANLYADLVLAELPAAARARLEEFMTTAPDKYRSDFARRWFSEGEAEGKAEGKAEGRAEGEARALLALLEARSIPVPDDVRGEVMACTDPDQLDAWIRRAATADRIEDVLD